MPDNPNVRGDVPPPAAPVRDATQQKLFDDAHKMPLYMRPGVCASCHPGEKKEAPNLRLLEFGAPDYGSFGKGDKGADFRKLLADLKQAKPLEPGEKPIEYKPLTEAEKFAGKDAIDKTATVLSRLPEKLKIEYSGEKLSLQTDFVKLVEATPGITLDQNAKEIFSKFNKLTLDGNTFTLDLKENTKLKLDVPEIQKVGKPTGLSIGDANTQVKFDIEFDAKNPDKVALKNIKGISLDVEGKKPIAIHSLSLDMSGGKAKLSVTADNPLTKPELMPAKLWLDKVSLTFDLDKVAPGMNADFLQGMVKTLSDSKAAAQNKDASMFLANIPDQALRTKLQEMLEGITSIEKDNDTLTIRRSNGVTSHDFGGPRLSVQPELSFKLRSKGEGVDISDVKGVQVTYDLPPEAGIGDKITVGVTGLSISPKYGDSRTLTVTADNLVDSVRVRLNQEMTPATDGNGHWRIDIRMSNPLDVAGRAKINLPLKFDSAGNLALSRSEITSIVAHVAASGIRANTDNVSRKVVQTADLARSTIQYGVSLAEEELRQNAMRAKMVADFVFGR